MCVFDNVACSRLVVACILTEIIATLFFNTTNIFSKQSENKLPISSAISCEDFSQGCCLTDGECYNVFVQDDEKAVAFMCRLFYGVTRC